MRFEVVQRGQIERVFTKNVIYLHKDGWNDWFKYETMFYLSYSDEKGNTVELGSIKIGQIGMEQRTPDLPKTFETLIDSIFYTGGKVKIIMKMSKNWNTENYERIF